MKDAYEKIDMFKVGNPLGTKHAPINFGNTMINFMAEDSENKIEAQTWSGLDDTTDSALYDLIDRSDFITDRAANAKSLTFNGQYFVVLLKIDGEWNINIFEISSYKSLKTKVLEITVEGKNEIIRGDTAYDSFMTWSQREDGRITRTTFFYNEEGNKEIEGSIYVYPSKVKRIPGMIIRNNPKAFPDFYNVMDMLNELNLLSNDIANEWENTKTIWQSIGEYGTGEAGEEFTQYLANGGRAADYMSGNSRFAQQFQVMMSGSNTLATLIQTIAWTEDRILKYSFQGRDSTESGTNKHNMQVGLFNQVHSEYVLKKIKQRQLDYLRFFKEIVEPITGIKAPASIVINNSVYEEGKLAGMAKLSEELELYKAQTEQQKALADKQLADAEKALADAKKSSAEAKEVGKNPKDGVGVGVADGKGNNDSKDI